MRADCLAQLKWQRRHLPAEVKDNLSPAEIDVRASVVVVYLLLFVLLFVIISAHFISGAPQTHPHSPHSKPKT